MSAQTERAEFGARGILRSTSEVDGKLEALWGVARRTGVQSIVQWYITNHGESPRN